MPNSHVVQGAGLWEAPPADRTTISNPATEAPMPQSRLLAYGVSLLLVIVATGAAFTFADRVGAPNLTLIFVLPVIASATWFGWGPSLLATVAGVLAFDFFFTEPKYSLAIDSPNDIWSAALLLVIAIAVSAVAAESRRRERAARRSAEQAQAVQALAHAVIQTRSPVEIIAAAAAALNRIFYAPAVVFIQRDDMFEPGVSAGGAKITAAEIEAAKGALESGLRSRSDTYPFSKSTFDFWRVGNGEAGGCVIGVGPPSRGHDRPTATDPYIEIVGAYLAIGLEHPTSGAPRA